MLKEQKGITLVALIITIIVMLILAGVSISLVVGENGVLTQAQNAGDATNEGAAKQAIELGFANLVMGYYGETIGTKTEKGEKTFTVAKLRNEIALAGNYELAVVTVTDESDAAMNDTDKLLAGNIKVKVDDMVFTVKIDDSDSVPTTNNAYPLKASKVTK